MENDLASVLAHIKPDDRVLDLGAWNAVIPRANVVIDLNPFETRRVVDAQTPERFNRASWIQGDVHSRALWDQFADKEFDFIICSHFLEDIRDPLFVCEQMNRVGRRGYIECPSRFRECAKTRSNDINSGYDHHRWIVDVVDGELVLTPKLAWAHAFDYIGAERRPLMYRKEVQFVGLFWSDSFNYYERFPKGSALEAANLLYFYDTVRVDSAPWILTVDDGLSKRRNPPGACLWVSEYSLPVENDTRFASYLAKAKRLLETGATVLEMPQTGNDTDSLRTQIAVCEARLRECEDRSAALHASPAWKVVDALRAFRKSIAPAGSRRDRVVQWLGRWLAAS